MKPKAATKRVVIRIRKYESGGWYLEFQEWIWEGNGWTNTAGSKDGSFSSIRLWTYPDLKSQIDEIKGVISHVRNIHPEHKIHFAEGGSERQKLEAIGITFREYGGVL